MTDQHGTPFRHADRTHPHRQSAGIWRRCYWHEAIHRLPWCNGLDAALAARLRIAENRPNQNNQIAARLALLGLQRACPVDDHIDDNVDLSDPVTCSKAIQAAWDKAAPRANAMRKRDDQLASKGKLLEFHRVINLSASQQVALTVDFCAALSEGLPQRYDYHYVFRWEISICAFSAM